MMMRMLLLLVYRDEVCWCIWNETLSLIIIHCQGCVVIVILLIVRAYYDSKYYSLIHLYFIK